MLNYIKSECYRVMHSRSTYVMTGIMAVLPVLFHIILYVTGVSSSTTQDFPYDITSFSFSFLAGSPMLFTYAGLIVAAVLYEDEHKNGKYKKCSGVWDFQRKAVFREMYDCSFDGNGYNGVGIDCLYRKCMVLVRAYGTDKPENYFNRDSGSVWNSSCIYDPGDRTSGIYQK